MTVFEESGLKFTFEDKDCFRVEKDPLVASTSYESTSNNKACECISLIDQKHVFIEVKSSAPLRVSGNVKDVRLTNQPLPKNWIVYDNYKNFLRDISKKFIDSFSILKALQEKRHGQERLDNLQNVGTPLNPDMVKFVLIINFQLPPDRDVDLQSLAILQDALKNEMRPFLKIWNIPDTSVKVVIPETARNLLKIPLQRG